MHYRDVHCPSDAQLFANCTHSGVGSGNCSNHTNDAGVICGKFNALYYTLSATVRRGYSELPLIMRLAILVLSTT